MVVKKAERACPLLPLRPLPRAGLAPSPGLCLSVTFLSFLYWSLAVAVRGDHWPLEGLSNKILDP